MLNYKRFTFNSRHSVFIAFLNITYCARHTFAVFALNNKVPIEVVSKMLGHTNIKTTQIYAKILNSEVEKGFDALEKVLRIR